MNLPLAQFQSAFAGALFQAPGHSAGPLAALTSQPAFAVYRNTVMKGCIDTLEANFPSVARLVGSEWFRAAAAIYTSGEPPVDGRMLRFGDGFADFLAGFEPAQEFSYLPDVARLDRCWTEAHAAADAVPVTGNDLALLAPEALAGIVLAAHPAARWRWFDDQPIYTIWSRNRSPEADESEIDWRGEGALITRASAQVTWCVAGRADCAFLDACADGQRLDNAAAAALTAQAEVDISHVLANLLRAGALCISDPASTARTTESTR